MQTAEMSEIQDMVFTSALLRETVLNTSDQNASDILIKFSPLNEGNHYT